MSPVRITQTNSLVLVAFVMSYKLFERVIFNVTKARIPLVTSGRKDLPLATSWLKVIKLLLPLSSFLPKASFQLNQVALVCEQRRQQRRQTAQPTEKTRLRLGGRDFRHLPETRAWRSPLVRVNLLER